MAWHMAGRGGETRAADLFILFHVVSDAAARAAQREGRPDHGGQANGLERVHRVAQAGDPVIALDLAVLAPDFR